MENDTRFTKKSDGEKYFIPMCKDCGLCCVDRDWSTDWLGKRIGICGNLDIKSGKCIDERKKSIICRTHACKTMEDFIDRIAFIMVRECPTASRLIQEMIIRKRESFTNDEIIEVQKALCGERQLKRIIHEVV